MEITRQADYAVRAVLELALQNGNGRIRSTEIAAKHHIPNGVLVRLLARLSAEGIVDAQRGVGGGIRLARTPGDVTMLQVVEAIDGPITLNRCMTRPGECRNDRTCVVHPVWASLRDTVREFLGRTTFEDLARRARERAPRMAFVSAEAVVMAAKRRT